MKVQYQWKCILGSLFLLNAGTPFLSAQTGLPSKVQSIEDLKKIEQRVQKVVAKARKATVGLTSISSGASGSGVIVNESGLILTAAHVSSRNKEMNVIFPDGKAHRAKVLGANRTKDVSMLQLIGDQKWPFVELGDSSSLDIGEHVIALGHAGGYDTRRPAPVRFGRLLKKNLKGFIMTDTTLIGGDSGGPLFDMDGKLVGINSSIGNSWKANNHAGITALVKDWDRLLKGDTWGRLNQNPLADPESPVMGFTFEETGNNGVIVTNVVDKSPAKKAGFQNGDILTAVGAEKVENGRDLLVAMGNHKPGDNVNVILKRGDKKVNYIVKLARRGEFFEER